MRSSVATASPEPSPSPEYCQTTNDKLGGSFGILSAMPFFGYVLSPIWLFSVHFPFSVFHCLFSFISFLPPFSAAPSLSLTDSQPVSSIFALVHNQIYSYFDRYPSDPSDWFQSCSTSILHLGNAKLVIKNAFFGF